MLTALLLTLLLIVALLAIPLSFSFNLSWPQRTHRELELQWAFGLVRLRIPAEEPPAVADELEGDELEALADEIEKAVERPAAKKKKIRTNFFAVIRQRPFRRRILKFLRDFWQAIHKQELRLYLRIGLDDPADTGQLWAMMGPLAALLANSRNVSYQLVPEFNEETFELQGSGRVEIVPLQLIYLLLAMLFSPAVWRGLKQLRTA